MPKCRAVATTPAAPATRGGPGLRGAPKGGKEKRGERKRKRKKREEKRKKRKKKRRREGKERLLIRGPLSIKLCFFGAPFDQCIQKGAPKSVGKEITVRGTFSGFL